MFRARECTICENILGRYAGSKYCMSSLHDAQVSEDGILAMIEKFAGIENLQSIYLFGKALPAILRGEVDLLNTPKEAGSLEGLSRAAGIPSQLTKGIYSIVRRIVRKHPHMDVLDLDAGTNTTRQILEALDIRRSSRAPTSEV
ncbi:uncharacterized protein VB005_04396 [Metarhizium brunneum]